MELLNEWLIMHWETIVDVFLWGFSFLMILLLAYMLFKIFKMRFKSIDLIGLVISVGWVVALLLFGFEDIRLFLLGVLYSDPAVL